MEVENTGIKALFNTKETDNEFISRQSLFFYMFFQFRKINFSPL
jgi:hypothetical protein